MDGIGPCEFIEVFFFCLLVFFRGARGTRRIALWILIWHLCPQVKGSVISESFYPAVIGEYSALGIGWILISSLVIFMSETYKAENGTTFPRRILRTNNDYHGRSQYGSDSRLPQMKMGNPGNVLGAVRYYPFSQARDLVGNSLLGMKRLAFGPS